MTAPEAYDGLVGALDYPMAIATTAADGRHGGCLVGFWTQCSIDPARHLVCVSDKNHTHRVLESGARAMVIHVVPEGAAELAELFGGETGDDADKFAQCDWSEGPDGIPVLDDCGSWFAGRILERLRLGDHVGYLLEPFDGRAGGGPALTFASVRHLEPGHEA